MRAILQLNGWSVNTKHAARVYYGAGTALYDQTSRFQETTSVVQIDLSCSSNINYVDEAAMFDHPHEWLKEHVAMANPNYCSRMIHLQLPVLAYCGKR